MHRYFIINKPYQMLSQFIGGHEGMRMLGDLDFDFPEGTHAIGRLDNLSEGLLLLTTNQKITKLLFQGKEKHTRTYLCKAYKNMDEETLHKLKTGVTFKTKDNADFTTTACAVEIVDKPINLFENDYQLPIVDVPHTWLTITLTEGKYHQIRKMLRLVGHKCQRLIRISIEGIELDNLQPGEVKELDEKFFFEKLKLETS